MSSSPASGACSGGPAPHLRHTRRMSSDPAPDEELLTTVQRLADTSLPTRHGTFRMTAYRDDTGEEHVALSVGIADDDAHDARPPLVRVHSECLTGDALGSRRCD